MSILLEGTLSELGGRMIVRIPLEQSKDLPSRGMVMAEGSINGVAFHAPLEPDGKGSHWLEVDAKLREALGAAAGDTVSLELSPAEKWAEPEMPEDIMGAIVRAGLTDRWEAVTTKARWEWLRWIRSTSNPATRQKRIEVACSKLGKGDKRPCCFDAARCTVPEMSKSGVLLD